MLSASGTSLCFSVQENCSGYDVRQKRSERTSVLWLKKTTYEQAFVLIKQLPQHLGLVISVTDFRTRVATADLSASRKIVYPTDARWNDANLQIRGANSNKFEIWTADRLQLQGSRPEMSKWKNSGGEGWAIIPFSVKVVRNQSVWLVSADSDPPSHCYSMHNNRMLVQKLQSPSAAARPAATPTGNENAEASNPQMDARVDALERPTNSMETRSSAIEAKFTEGFAEILDRLDKDKASASSRRVSVGKTGKAPPPKQPKNSTTGSASCADARRP